MIQELLKFNPTLSVSEATLPPASWYTSKDFFELEKQKLFADSWLYVALTKDLRKPGQYVSGDYVGRPYIVSRARDGQLYAFYNVCLHHGACVTKSARGQTSRLTCSYHGWNYNSAGEVVATPGVKTPEQMKGRRLKPIACKEVGDFVLIHFGDHNEPVPPSYREVAKAISFSGYSEVYSSTYALNCNWKVFVDNYLDGGYHVPFMHKGLAQQLNLKNYQSKIYEGYSLQSCYGASLESQNNRTPTETLDFRERVGAEANYFWLYPNFMINQYGPWIDTNLVVPIDENSCQVRFVYYYLGEVSQEVLEKSILASDKVQEEDETVCMEVQKGLNSGAYQQGCYVSEFEEPMFAFHRQLVDHLLK